MRVLHIFNELKFSGAEIMYANAASLFQKKGVEMLVLSTGEQIGDFLPQFEAENIEVHYRKLSINEANPLRLMSYFQKVYLFVKTNNIEVIHIHRSKHFWFFSLVGFLSGTRTIRTVHNNFKHRKLTWIKGFLERYTATKFFNVKFQTIGRSVYENELHYYKNNSYIVNNWYDSTKFYPLLNLEEKFKIRESLGIAKNQFVIISSGGCSYVKNHHDIIKALAIVDKKIDCVYLHLGQGLTENEEKDLAKQLGVYGKIKFLGNKQNVRDYLIASDVYLMPSQFEGLSIAAIEAMASGLPSVLYNSPGLRDLIDKDDNGLLINPDYKELASSLLQLYYEPNMRLEMGNRAEVFVKNNFSVRKGVDGIMDLYKK
ncbi:glycosyltransferase family 4 protein [Maribacter sp. TH_r10]|uniref:glycosyltransferase family 4 protein n=1 Tax=Maribacter sp. TH_r10 TaxID=3082086 RepID=UPI002955D202|nr:glycosyltransferase family 4 protein [Maribacter sp. TH_r10]MDV7140202.1 glycosyltransferase family 4 protein [Maribacter sp. TH_r10]